MGSVCREALAGVIIVARMMAKRKTSLVQCVTDLAVPARTVLDTRDSDVPGFGRFPSPPWRKQPGPGGHRWLGGRGLYNCGSPESCPGERHFAGSEVTGRPGRAEKAAPEYARAVMVWYPGGRGG